MPVAVPSFLPGSPDWSLARCSQAIGISPGLGSTPAFLKKPLYRIAALSGRGGGTIRYSRWLTTRA
jgi:hypothetical protein